MSVDLIDVAAALPRVPNLHVLVLASSEDQRLGGMPVTRFQVRSMLCELELLRRCDEIKNFGPAIVSARDKLQ